MQLYLSSLCFLLAFLPSWAFAQFGFFDQMFQGGQRQQQQRQGGGGNQAPAIADSTPCNKYLCPSTFVCAETPADCPCPYPEDIKCIVPDLTSSGRQEGNAGTVVCVRGDKGCGILHELM